MVFVMQDAIERDERGPSMGRQCGVPLAQVMVCTSRRMGGGGRGNGQVEGWIRLQVGSVSDFASFVGCVAWSITKIKYEINTCHVVPTLP